MYKTLEQLPAPVRRRLRARLTERHIRRSPRIFSDTFESMEIDYGDVIFIEGRYFLVTGFGREGRFGIDEQLKYWVKKTIELESGARYIIKCVFYETFQIKLGGLRVTCYRSPQKEARVLALTRGNKFFMQGYGVEDESGNLLRVIENIRGKRLDKFIDATGGSHRQYFDRHVPDILARFIKSAEAIGFLHAHGLKHGDIRRDHILIDAESGIFRWIDFDYDFYLPERPYAMDLMGLGNILLYIIGRRNYRSRDVLADPTMGERVLVTLSRDDFSLLFQDRIFNLKKLFPYIPARLNDILLHFSYGAGVYYETVAEFCDDLKACLEAL